jgi:ankyrin repeat protein
MLSIQFAKAQDIFNAVRTNQLAEVEKYVQAGTDINAANERGFTPLILAVYFLIEKGAHVDAQDKNGNNALMGATFKAYPHMVKILIDKGAKVNQVNFNGASALTFAATFGQVKIAEMLLQQQADKSISDNLGKTALDYAIVQENKEMIELLSK